MRVGVVGAGLVGAWLAARLSAAGVDVTLVGRRPPERPVAVDLDGREHLPSGTLELASDLSSMAEADVVLVCVKSRDTAAVGEALATVLAKDVTVITLQNGLSNAGVLRRSWPHVVGGFVTSNFRRAGGRVVQETGGPVVMGACEAADVVATALRKAGVEARVEEQIEPLQRAKLLLNLNNGLCCVTGLSLTGLLAHRELRDCLAACIREGLAVFAKAGLEVRPVGLLGPSLVARVLRWPDLPFRLAARGMLRINPEARPSTLQDLEAGRPTEIDELAGEVVRLAHAHGTEAPLNAWVVEQVHRLESEGPARRHLGRVETYTAMNRIWSR